MIDNVISIQSRKPIAVEKEEEQREFDELDKERIAEQLEIIDGLRRLAEQGGLKGVMVIGAHETGYYYHELWMRAPFMMPNDLFGVVGLLETIKLEVTDAAMSAPVLHRDGSILDPFAEGDDLYEED